MLFRKFGLVLLMTVGLSLSGFAVEPEPPLQQGLFRGLNQGYVGSLLFRGPTHGTPPQKDGLGILDLLVMGGLMGWLLNRTHQRRREEGLHRASYYDQWVHLPKPMSFEIQDLGRWVEYFLNIQHAWSRQELTSVREVLAPSVFRQLENELQKLRSEKRINRLEQILLRDVTLVDRWQEGAEEFATVHYQGIRVTEGDPNRPIDVDEFWAFRRAPKAVKTSKAWVVTEIRRRDSDAQLPRMASLH